MEVGSMKRFAGVLTVLAIVAISMTTSTCKPIPYYLARVCKAYGKVTDGATGLPLESVEVSIGTYEYSELTNGLGDYELELADGTWTLQFEREGYETWSVDVTVNSVDTPKCRQDAVLVPVLPVLPDISGVWIGDEVVVNNSDPENPLYGDYEFTFGPNSTFQAINYIDVFAEPKESRVMGGHPSSFGTYTVTSATTIDSLMTSMYFNDQWTHFVPPVSTTTTFSLNEPHLTIEAGPGLSWTLTRQ
jgi:hypothetical protein